MVYLAQRYVGGFSDLRGPAAHEPVGHPGALAIGFQPDGEHLVSLATSGQERVWDLHSGAYQQASLVGRGFYRSDTRAISLDAVSDLCVSNCTDAVYTTRLHTTNGAVRLPDLQHAWASTDGTAVLGTGAEAGAAVVLNARSRALVARVQAPGGRRFVALDLERGGRHLAAFLQDPAGARGSLWVWDLRGNTRQQWMADLPAKLAGVRYSPDGCYLAVQTGVDTGLCTILETATRREVLTFSTGIGSQPAFRFSSDSRLIAYPERREREFVVTSLSMERRRETVETLQVRDVRNGAQRIAFHRRAAVRGHRDPIVDCAWSPDGRRVATLSWDGRIALWNARDGKFLAFLDGDNRLKE